MLTAVLVAASCYVVTGLCEEALIRLFQPTELELGWISDAMLSCALGVAVYLWLNLRATRLRLTGHERAQVVLHTQLSLAEAMQRRLLPDVPPPDDGVEWAAVLTPADRIGGDFFDFVEPEPGVRLMLIADVSGKGIAAAMALTLLRSTFRRIARDTGEPSKLATLLSDALQDEWHGSPYVTGIIVRMDWKQRTLTCTNAGHPGGLLIRDGVARLLTKGGPPLGLLEGAAFAQESLSVVAGDVGVFVTDGVSEALDDVRQSWHSRILNTVRAGTLRSAGEICRALAALARDGAGPEGLQDWSDDRTVVVLRVTGDTSRAKVDSAEAGRAAGPVRASAEVA